MDTPMDIETSKRVVFINTIVDSDEFLPYSKDSIKKGYLNKNPKYIETIKKLANQKETILSTVAKNKILKTLDDEKARKKTANKREEIQGVINKINSLKVDDKVYSEKPDEKVMGVLNNFVSTRLSEEILKKVEILPAPIIIDKNLDKQKDKLLAESKVIAASNEEEDVLAELNGLKDDFVEAFKLKGYSEELQNEYFTKLSGRSKDDLQDILTTVLSTDVPISLSSISYYFPEKKLPADSTLGSVPVASPIVDTSLNVVSENIATQPISPEATNVDIAAENVAVQPAGLGVNEPAGPVNQDTETIGVQDQTKPSTTTNSAALLPYVKRYHENSILLYFGDSSYPDWDKVLESNVMKMEASKETIVKMMDDIIKEYGTKIFVEKRKSETREELNELIQLQFCVMRNLQIGTRAKTANVKLADLVRIDKLANSQAIGLSQVAGTTNGLQGGPSPQGVVSVNQIVPVSTTNGETRVSTKSEDAFIRNYDNYLIRKNLNANYTRERVPVIPKMSYENDPRVQGIIPGNNKIALEKYSIRRL